MQKFWGFHLTNLKFCHGDEQTPRGVPDSAKICPEEYFDLIAQYRALFPDAPPQPAPGTPIEVVQGFSLDEIKFSWADREWTLVNPSDENIHPKNNEVLVTQCLVTQFKEGDSIEKMKQEVDSIALLLSFALGLDIKCLMFSLIGEFGGCERAFTLRGFNNRGPIIVDNYSTLNIKNFLEGSETVVRQDTEWFRMTLVLFIEASTNQILHVKWYIFNILLDRITKRICYSLGAPSQDRAIVRQIVEGADFQMHLNSLFNLIPSNCKSYFKSLLLNKIRDSIVLNNSFADRVARACNDFKIDSTPLAQYLDFRNGLLHTGDFEDVLDDSEKIKYLFVLQDTITLLVLRLLNFDGDICLQEKDQSHQPISSFLLS